MNTLRKKDYEGNKEKEIEIIEKRDLEKVSGGLKPATKTVAMLVACLNLLSPIKLNAVNNNTLQAPELVVDVDKKRLALSILGTTSFGGLVSFTLVKLFGDEGKKSRLLKKVCNCKDNLQKHILGREDESIIDSAEERLFKFNYELSPKHLNTYIDYKIKIFTDILKLPSHLKDSDCKCELCFRCKDVKESLKQRAASYHNFGDEHFGLFKKCLEAVIEDLKRLKSKITPETATKLDVKYWLSRVFEGEQRRIFKIYGSVRRLKSDINKCSEEATLDKTAIKDISARIDSFRQKFESWKGDDIMKLYDELSTCESEIFNCSYIINSELHIRGKNRV